MITRRNFRILLSVIFFCAGAVLLGTNAPFIAFVGVFAAAWVSDFLLGTRANKGESE